MAKCPRRRLAFVQRDCDVVVPNRDAVLKFELLLQAQRALKPFRAEGLHSAMYAIPILSVLLAIVLFAASRTVTKEIDKLQNWMRDCMVPAPQTTEKIEP